MTLKLFYLVALVFCVIAISLKPSLGAWHLWSLMLILSFELYSAVVTCVSRS